MEEVVIFIEELDGKQRDIAEFMHVFLLQHAEMEPKIRFKIPFYFIHSWICYLNPIKDDKIELAFVRANELSDHSDILDFKKRTQIAGVELYELSQIPTQRIVEILQEAILLDEAVPYKLRKKKKNS